MSATIPENTVTQADLAEWYRLKQELGRIKSAEALLRGKIFHFFFTNPVEGTNTHELDDGTGAVLKGGHVINRTVDPGALDALREEQARAFGEEANSDSRPNVPRVRVDDLIKWKPELVIGEYRKLTAEERNYFDQALVIKPGAPTVEIVIPKRAKA